MEELIAKHKAAVERQQSARSEVARLQGMLAEAKAERDQIDGEIETALVDQALARKPLNADWLLHRRNQLDAEIAALPRAIEIAQRRANDEAKTVGWLSQQINDRQREADQDELRKKIETALAAGEPMEAVRKSLGMTAREFENLAPASHIGGTNAYRRGEAG